MAENLNHQREQEEVSFSQAVIDRVYYTNDYLHHSLCCNMLVLGVCVCVCVYALAGEGSNFWLLLANTCLIFRFGFACWSTSA